MTTLLWITKTAQSAHLSRSQGQEQLDILSQAQRVSRQRKAANLPKAGPRKRTSKARSRIAVEKGRSKSPLYNAKSQHIQVVGNSPENIHVFYSSGHSSPPLLDSSLHRDREWSMNERRSALYFQEITVREILTLQRDREFWKVIVPCIAENDSGIRHIMVAIGAFSELLCQPEASSLHYFALTQCNKAIRAILSFDSLNRLSLLTSCILIAAYHLLRSDAESADKSVESGIKMLKSTSPDSDDTGHQVVSRVLNALGQQHGYKLWSVDMTFQIDKTVATDEAIDIVVDVPKGPFTEVSQLLEAFKALMIGGVAKTTRNVALGAHVDPSCFFARSVSEIFSDTIFHWEIFFHSLPEDRTNEKLQLVQLKIGLLVARWIFLSKLLASDELRGDSYLAIHVEVLKLGQEVITARREGRPVIYLDRIVNGALFTCAMFCREPKIRYGLIYLLKSQVAYVDGLVNFLRGRIAEILRETEEQGLDVKHCHDIPRAKRLGVADMRCEKDRVLCIGFMTADAIDRANLVYHFSRLPTELDAFAQQEVEDCLKGMMAAYKMYRKLDLPLAPDGCLRPMYYLTRQVKVLWRDDILAGREDTLAELKKERSSPDWPTNPP